MKRASRPLGPARQRALDAMRERHPRVAAHFLATHGLVLSQQVMLLAAFFRGLDDEQRAAAERLGIAPAGITQWFADGGLDRVPVEGLDPRLHFRFACDPPEMVTVMTGHADGLHYGLFHDEVRKPPWLVSQSFARDGGEVTAFTGRGTTILDGLHVLVRRVARHGVEAGALLVAIEELAEAGAAIVKEEQKGKPKPERLDTIAGTGPSVVGASRLGWPSIAERRAAYAAQDSIVDRWIADARAALPDAPGLALLIGRDLFFRGTSHQEEAVALQIAAYQALGRAPFAEIVRVHAAHRDRASVDVYRSIT